MPTTSRHHVVFRRVRIASNPPTDPPKAEKPIIASGKATLRGTVALKRLGVEAETWKSPHQIGSKIARPPDCPGRMVSSLGEISPRPWLIANENKSSSALRTVLHL